MNESGIEADSKNVIKCCNNILEKNNKKLCAMRENYIREQMKIRRRKWFRTYYFSYKEAEEYVDKNVSSDWDYRLSVRWIIKENNDVRRLISLAENSTKGKIWISKSDGWIFSKGG